VVELLPVPLLREGADQVFQLGDRRLRIDHRGTLSSRVGRPRGSAGQSQKTSEEAHPLQGWEESRETSARSLYNAVLLSHRNHAGQVGCRVGRGMALLEKRGLDDSTSLSGTPSGSPSSPRDACDRAEIARRCVRRPHVGVVEDGPRNPSETTGKPTPFRGGYLTVVFLRRTPDDLTVWEDHGNEVDSSNVSVISSLEAIREASGRFVASCFKKNQVAETGGRSRATSYRQYFRDCSKETGGQSMIRPEQSRGPWLRTPYDDSRLAPCSAYDTSQSLGDGNRAHGAR